MKSHRGLIGIFGLLLTVCGVGAVLGIWDRHYTLYPTPKTESAFFKNYTPQGVIERFECRLPSLSLHEGGATAGHKFVTHDAGFKWQFAMRTAGWTTLMNALSDDVSERLVNNGAQILSSSGDHRSGFHFDYRLGESTGTVTILPLAVTPPSRIQRRTPLPEGVADTYADIQLSEKWFPDAEPRPR